MLKLPLIVTIEIICVYGLVPAHKIVKRRLLAFHQQKIKRKKKTITLIGIGGVGVGEGNFNIATQFRANGGWQRNSYSQANSLNYNTANELPRKQAIITPSFQVVNEHYNMQMDFTGSQYRNQMNQDEIRKMQIIREIVESQAYADIWISNWEVLPGMDVEEDW